MRETILGVLGRQRAAPRTIGMGVVLLLLCSCCGAPCDRPAGSRGVVLWWGRVEIGS